MFVLAGFILTGMFSEGSATYPLLKYVYDRHVANYATIPHSNFKPYITMQTPGGILAKVKK